MCTKCAYADEELTTAKRDKRELKKPGRANEILGKFKKSLILQSRKSIGKQRLRHRN